jgi:tetratricopeptide (TPR) repeat protein
MYRTFVSVHAGDPQAAIAELDELVASIDGMGIPEPTGQKINTLTNQAIIALHIGDLDAAERALERRTELMNDESVRVGTDDFRRGQDANIAYWDGMLAARRGDYATARSKSDEFTTLVESDRNPRKMEPVHDLMGYASLLRGSHREAVQHLEQSFPNNLYTKYNLARAHEGAGNTAEAKRLYGEIADNNFNNVVFALVRTEAMQKR